MSSEDLTEKGDGAGYILVDFDRTLSKYAGWSAQGQGLGAPVPAMVARVQRWLHSGVEVRLFTARASRQDHREHELLESWCKIHLGRVLKIQNWKCFKCIQIWDDLAVGVYPNTGERLNFSGELCHDPLSDEEEGDIIQAEVDKEEYLG